MSRIQSGYTYEASGAFFVRYYVTEIVDGEQKRVQRSERLCSKDAEFYARNAKTVELLRDEFMLAVNQQAGQVNVADTTVVDFWEKTYFPYANGEPSSFDDARLPTDLGSAPQGSFRHADA